MPTFVTKELEKAYLGEGSNGVVGKPTTKRVFLLWAYGKHLKNLSGGHTLWING